MLRSFKLPLVFWIIGVISVPLAYADKHLENSSAPFVHMVVMTLKDGTPQEAIDAFIADSYKLLSTRPTVRGFKIGRPANPGSDDAEKGNYIAMLVLYDDFKGLEASLTHPNHLAFDDRHIKWVEKFQIFDFVDHKAMVP